MSLFDTALDITLKGYVKADGRPLLDTERAALINHLRNQGLESRFAVEILRHPSRLPDGSIYITYSGSGGPKRSDDFIEEMTRAGRSAGKIGDTPWGQYTLNDPQANRVAQDFANDIDAFARENFGITVTGAITPKFRHVH